MNGRELKEAIAKAENLPASIVQAVLQQLASQIQSTLRKNGAVSLPGVGKFGIRKSPARKGRNPNTHEQINIRAMKRPTFSASIPLKDYVN